MLFLIPFMLVGAIVVAVFWPRDPKSVMKGLTNKMRMLYSLCGVEQ